MTEPSSDLAEFAKHLRSVNFALITVTAALFLANAAGPDPTLSRARADLERLLDLEKALCSCSTL